MVDPREIENYEVTKGVAIWFLGGPSLAIRSRQSLVYLDLFAGPSPVPEVVTRDIPDGLDPLRIKFADYVISTHHDEDHCNENTLKAVHSAADAIFLGPVSCNKLYRKWGLELGRTRLIGQGETLAKNDLKVHALGASDVFDPDAISYVLDFDGVKIFEGGDTLYFEELNEIGKQFDIDIAFLSTATNPPDAIYYMTDEQLVQAADALGAKVVILKHYDLWREFKKDPRNSLSLLRAKGQDARVYAQGELLVYP